MLPRPLVKGARGTGAASVPDVLARAVHLAVAAPSGPVFVSVPLDDWRHDADDGTVERLSARLVSGRPRAAAESLAAVATRRDAAAIPCWCSAPRWTRAAGRTLQWRWPSDARLR